MNAPPARFPGRAPIEAYGNGGFRFAGMSHRGSILCLPSGISAWEPAYPLDASSLAPALAEKEALGLLILGTGRRPELPASDLRRAFAEAGVSLGSHGYWRCLPDLQRAAGRRASRRRGADRR